MKSLLLVRHADALPLGGPIASDPERPLSDKGLRQAEALADFLVQKSIQADLLLSSPYLRAVQTAEPLKRLLADAAATSELDDLTPDRFQPERLLQLIHTETVRTAVVVGHNPSISYYLAEFVGQTAGMGVAMKKGAAAWIDFPEPNASAGQLIDLFLPKQYMS